MKILLFGADGQLGFELQRGLAVLGEVQSVRRRQNGQGTDLSDTDALRQVIQQARPHVIVNAAAYVAVDQAESARDEAFAINARAVATMAEQARELSALLVHFSTDYVFSGQNRLPWTETDPTQAINAYGASKLAGEKEILASRCAHWILRVQSLYSARRSNFLKTMLRLARDDKPVRVVQDQVIAPTPARWIADAVLCMLSRWLSDGGQSVPSSVSSSGVYHVSAAGHTTWFEFARAIFQQAYALGIVSHPVQVQAISSTEFSAPAARPSYSVFNCEKIQQRFDICLPHWREGLQQVLDEIKQAQSLKA
jgi:dTDP-4-dehydrorhamnose reductase